MGNALGLPQLEHSGEVSVEVYLALATALLWAFPTHTFLHVSSYYFYKDVHPGVRGFDNFWRALA